MDRPAAVAALYDIHGNLAALEAVLAEVERLGIERIVVGGDIVWGPEPVPTLERLMRLGSRARFIRGNADREVADGSAGPNADPAVEVVTRWCHRQLNAGQRAFLGALPERVSLDVPGWGPILFCHGSPRRDDEAIHAWTREEDLAPMVAAVREGVVVCGHTHAPFDRDGAGKRIVNAGSVGLQYGAGASWALVGPEIELRRTPYDVEAAATRIRRSGVPDPEIFADHILDPPPMPT
ncbi:MAG: Serine/threonine protein phosphatase() [uncultured Thermomicrobiales bacterium]|uniref:Serine/threonine protein phosphatase( ) n=1 Tax=uncultured Thermomicrobiales bacterium TaxID=1645740 RepID=A0A6J4UU33_9BACT|nr:MAG: Serine/threonine protein phosphatase() [uncultured Thermomicrobiales bacterium]